MMMLLKRSQLSACTQSHRFFHTGQQTADVLTELPNMAANSRALQGSYTQNKALLIPRHTSRTGGEAPLPVSCRNCVKLGMSMT